MTQELNISTENLAKLNDMIALYNRMEQDEAFKNRMVEEMMAAYRENRMPNFK